MENLSNGTLLEMMREECRSMLSTTATTKIRAEHPDSSMSRQVNFSSQAIDFNLI